jgi:hypothetical protein
LKKLSLAILILVVLSSCNPRVVLKTSGTEMQPYILGSVIVLSKQEKFDSKGIELGDIKVVDTGFSGNCSYENVVDLAVEKAKLIGANCIKIYEHTKPSIFGSRCHQIKAKAYNIPNISDFEKRIVWQVKRKLKVVDFKGTKINRPFLAATFSNFTYQYYHKPFTKFSNLDVEAYFDCEKSYFKDTIKIEQTLEHEQIHFDISELYARKFTKLITEQAKNSLELEEIINNILDQTRSELDLFQDKYDSEVYADRTKQKIWLIDIKNQLDSLKEFENKSLKIPFKINFSQ